MIKPLNVLSMCDGIGTGKIALAKAGIPVRYYLAAEIDSHCIKASHANYPEIIQLGNIYDISVAKIPFQIDLVFCGFPCQSFSVAGNQKKFDDPRGQVFWQGMKVLYQCMKRWPNVKFLFENVRMDKHSCSIISNAFGFDPIFIDSALVCAQTRKRFYWFGGGREILFYDNCLCKECSDGETKISRIRRTASYTREGALSTVALGEKDYLQNMSRNVFANVSAWNNQHMLKEMSGIKQEAKRCKQRQDKVKGVSQRVLQGKQGRDTRISKELEADGGRESFHEKGGCSSGTEIEKAYEDAFIQTGWWKVPFIQRGLDGYYENEEGLCCMRCGKRLNNRSYNALISWWDKRHNKLADSMSEVQLFKARQNYGRIYETVNLGDIVEQPEDRGIMLQDILETDVDERYNLSDTILARINTDDIRKKLYKLKLERDKSRAVISSVGRTTYREYFEKNQGQLVEVVAKINKSQDGKVFAVTGKSQCLSAGHNNTPKIVQLNPAKEFGNQPRNQHRKYDADYKCPYINSTKAHTINIAEHRAIGVVNSYGSMRTLKDKSLNIDANYYKGIDNHAARTHVAHLAEDVIVHNIQPRQGKGQGGKGHIMRYPGNKPYCLDTACGQAVEMDLIIRRLTPTECHRLQGIPDGYLSMLSDTQQYKALGNGWQADTIAHILSYYKQ